MLSLSDRENLHLATARGLSDAASGIAVVSLSDLVAQLRGRSAV
jgi:hypothetical protein